MRAPCKPWERDEPQTVRLAGSWPRPAIGVLQRAIECSGSPLVIVSEDRDDAARIHRDRCTVSWTRNGRRFVGGDAPEDGLAVNGVGYRAALCLPGDDDRTELIDLTSDYALLWEDEDLDIEDIRPIATTSALADGGAELARFLERCCQQPDANDALRRKAAALARHTPTPTRIQPFDITRIAEYGIGMRKGDPAARKLHEMANERMSTPVCEPGVTTWGWLFALRDHEIPQIQGDREIRAALAWSDGSEENARWGVQLLTATEADHVQHTCTGTIIEQVRERYRRAGGSDDLHDAHALYASAETRRITSETQTGNNDACVEEPEASHVTQGRKP